MTALVDVVVPTRDRPQALDACLRALAAQSFKEARVIVVDDGSTVPVEDTLAPALREDLDLLVLRNESSMGPAAARNRGVASGSAPYIAFIDDDVRADKNLLAEQLLCHERFGDRSIIIGPLRAPEGWEPTAWNRWEANQLEVEYERMERGEYRPTWRQFHTGNAFLPRYAFEELGGFDEQFTRAEDVEFALRAAQRGYTFAFNPRAHGWHDAYRSRGAWLHIPRAYAEFDVLMDQLHPDARWLPIVERERQHRHVLMRSLRGVSKLPFVANGLAYGLTVLAAGVFRTGLERPSMGLLSLAYDLRYETAFRRAVRRPRGGVGRPPVTASGGRR